MVVAVVVLLLAAMPLPLRIVAVAASVWGLVRHAAARRRAAEKNRLWWPQKFGEHVKPLLGWTDKTWPWPESSLLAVWPFGNEYWPGAQIVARYARGWQATPARLAALTGQAVTFFGGEWTSAVDPGKNHVILTRQADPFVLPPLLHYQDITGTAHRIPIGVRGDGRPVEFDLRGESPHALISAPSGKGKTTLLSVIAAHAAHHGAAVTIIDPKIAGYATTFRGLHNIRVLTPASGDRVAGMAAAVIDLAARIDARYAEMDKGRPEASYDGEVLLLIVDEVGRFSDQVTEQWRAGGGKNTPPALSALKQCLELGRMARCHLVAASQHPDVAALGGRTEGIKGAYDLKIALGRPDEATVSKMFGTRAVCPPVPSGPGRAVMEFDSVLEVVQLAYLDIKDGRRARAIAATGTGTHPEPTNPTSDDLPPTQIPTPGPVRAATATTAPPTQPEPAPDVADVADAALPHVRAHRPANTAATSPATPPATSPATPVPAFAPLTLRCRCGHEWESTKGTHDRCPQCRTAKRTGRKPA